MKILILGKGFLGGKYEEYFRTKYWVNTSRVDIGSSEISNELKYFDPDVVINCAAKSGRPNVDWCESHKVETLRSNLEAPLNLMRHCLAQQKYLVQLGSGCIYEGDNNGNGFGEDDDPNFFRSFYSTTKAALNIAMKPFPVLQLRLRMPLDAQPGPRNLITKLASYPEIISLPNSVTFIDELLTTTEALILQRATGIYNVVSPQPITQQQLLECYKQYVDPTHQYKIISLAELETKTAAGRSNCVLSTKKLRDAGIILQPTLEKLEVVMKQYAAISA